MKAVLRREKSMDVGSQSSYPSQQVWSVRGELICPCVHRDPSAYQVLDGVSAKQYLIVNNEL